MSQRICAVPVFRPPTLWFAAFAFKTLSGFRGVVYGPEAPSNPSSIARGNQRAQPSLTTLNTFRLVSKKYAVRTTSKRRLEQVDLEFDTGNCADIDFLLPLRGFA